ncbi:uncharacterized protein LOC113217393 isoform X1 [Frankliniella occidentalis]|uniref:Uncharacterized protein LOC113217393 isoform X1 n=1 Tax=Frankliniella occidentalis TaxID=133901 RepID=A0A9C6X4R2_FRAOC|nr:uncharacterized protein LOC113217393 isoform X1 [Frankliniella occidentalis]
MDCDSCLEDYDQAERVPKIVPCGHTVCLRCLRQSARRQCPTCCRYFFNEPDTLPNNFTLLQLMEHSGSPAPRLVLGLPRRRRAPLLGPGDEVHAEKRRRVESQDPPAYSPAPNPCGDAGSPLVAASPPAESTFNFPLPPTAAIPCLLPWWGRASSQQELSVEVISLYGPSARQQDKAALLAEASGLTRLVDLNCDHDPAWSLQLLQRVAPTLERLSLGSGGSEPHLRAVHAMPRLTRLTVWGGDDVVPAQPFELPALPPGHVGLRWLATYNVARSTTKALLRVHSRTLAVLELGVGTAGSEGWPVSCNDLDSLLEQSGLRALSWLVLRRYRCSHEPAACSKQRAEVRRVLPWAQVLCGRCDDVEEEHV